MLGNNLEKLKELTENSVDAVVTDPPYGLSFMGKKWDYDVPSVDLWREVFRVLKPGGHVLSFGGTRTYHRMVVNIEDAGFEIRDQVMWIYGSGFPKSTNVSKRIDKERGTQGEEYIDEEFLRRNPDTGQSEKGIIYKGLYDGIEAAKRFKPGCEEAKQWQGWGTALKPANEPICLARKPLEKGLTVAENVQKWGTGAINVDGSRIASSEKLARPFNDANNEILGKYARFGNPVEPQGRWPANVLFDEEAANGHEWSRFFYIAKASKRERNAGLEGMPLKPGGSNAKGYTEDVARGLDRNRPVANHHPTVKPIKLMEYLIKLVTPPSGTVLDPFMGSGSTGIAAKNLSFNFIGCELNEEYFEIAKKRIEFEKSGQHELSL